MHTNKDRFKQSIKQTKTPENNEMGIPCPMLHDHQPQLARSLAGNIPDELLVAFSC
jgi:hypothetical protein